MTGICGVREKMAKQTPLYDQHVACGARMVDFHGWMMPLHYGSQIDEHHAVRQDAGMFEKLTILHCTQPVCHWNAGL